MKILLGFILGLIFTSTVTACEDDLKEILVEALEVVEKNVDQVGDKCQKSARHGRSRGRPGCFPPEVFKLTDILKVYFEEANHVCLTECLSEKQMSKCDYVLN